MGEAHDSLERKIETLHDILSGYRNLAIAFSGGVDSTLLLAVARQQLGDSVVAMTARSPVYAKFEENQAVELAGGMGTRHVLFAPDLLADDAFRANGPERCYHCKKCLFGTMRVAAEKMGFTTLAHGANVDDCHDFRPGLRAAAEMGVVAPLSEAGMTKNDIRRLAREMGLPNWNRPAMACLATRLPYGTPIEPVVLSKIEAAEQILRQMGFSQCRVRYHHAIARIEVGIEEIENLMLKKNRLRIVEDLQALGFRHVCLDLEGYVSGKMNRDLPV